MKSKSIHADLTSRVGQINKKTALPEFTRWFSAAVKPARDGVYQRRSAQGYVWFAKYSDGEWSACTAGSSVIAADYARALRPEHESERNLPWRGLASNPARSNNK